MLARVLILAAATLAIAPTAPTAPTTPTATAQAGNQVQKPAQAQDQAPVNRMCPVGKEPIVASAGTDTYAGRLIGFCCPGCAEEFEAWDEADKAEFLRVALASPAEAPGAQPQPEAQTPAEDGGRPYTLDTCAVSGEKLGSMGEPIVKVYDGREVRFCCDGCIGGFEADKAGYFAKVDEAMIRQQLMHYPLTTCAVRGGELGGMGEPVNMIHDNRLVRFCCSGCIKAFKADPEKHFAEMDAKIIAQQAPAYPLTDCPVGEHAHGGADGASYDIVYMNRLVRLCCEGCEPKLYADPASYMAKLDKAHADAQRAEYPLSTCVVGGDAFDDDAVEIVAGTQLVRLCCEGCVDDFKAEPQKYLEKIAAAKGDQPGASGGG